MILFSGFFEPLFYLFFFVYPLQKFVGDGHVRRGDDRVRRVRRTSAARVVGHERRLLRRDERLLEAAGVKVYESILATPVGPKDVAVGETIWAVCARCMYCDSRTSS